MCQINHFDVWVFRAQKSGSLWWKKSRGSQWQWIFFFINKHFKITYYANQDIIFKCVAPLLFNLYSCMEIRSRIVLTISKKKIYVIFQSVPKLIQHGVASRKQQNTWVNYDFVKKLLHSLKKKEKGKKKRKKLWRSVSYIKRLK